MRSMKTFNVLWLLLFAVILVGVPQVIYATDDLYEDDYNDYDDYDDYNDYDDYDDYDEDKPDPPKIEIAKSKTILPKNTEDIDFDILFDSDSLSESYSIKSKKCIIKATVVGKKCIKVSLPKISKWYDEEEETYETDGYYVSITGIKSGSCKLKISVTLKEDGEIYKASKTVNIKVKTLNKNQKKIYSVTDQYMKAVKGYDTSKIRQCFHNNNFYTWKPKTGYAKFVRYLHKKHFDYFIKDVSVKGKKGTAKVKISYYDAYDLSKDALDDLLYNWAIYRSTTPSSTEIANKFYKCAKAQYSNYKSEYGSGYVVSKMISISFEQKKGKWKIPKVTGTLKKMMDCRTMESSDDYWDKYK